jgi:hypothetical protein
MEEKMEREMEELFTNYPSIQEKVLNLLNNIESSFEYLADEKLFIADMRWDDNGFDDIFTKCCAIGCNNDAIKNALLCRCDISHNPSLNLCKECITKDRPYLIDQKENSYSCFEHILISTGDTWYTIRSDIEIDEDCEFDDIKELFTKELKELQRDPCAICYERFRTDDIIAPLQCTHEFHLSCHAQQIEQTKDSRCACCRQGSSNLVYKLVERPEQSDQ